MKTNTNTVLIVVSALVVAAGAYWYFFTDTGNEPPLTEVTTSTGAQARFRALVSELQPITFDTRIFSDPRFAALVDLTTPILPETPGRLDPFEPIAGVSQ